MYLGLDIDGLEIGGAKPRTTSLQAKSPVKKYFSMILVGLGVGLWLDEENEGYGQGQRQKRSCLKEDI